MADKEEKDNDRFRTFSIPQELAVRSAGIRSAVKMFVTKQKSSDKAEAERVKDIFRHAVSTANFTYQYYTEYLKGKSQIDPDALYIAAIYFNYYKLTTEGAENKDLTAEELRNLMKRKSEVNAEIRGKSGQGEAVKYLFVTDDTGKTAHEVIFAANAIDNLMCIKNDKDEPLSLATVFSIMSSSESFSPEVVRNFEKMFIRQIKDGAEEYKISFSSSEEKTAFGSLDKRIRDSLFTVISMVMDSETEGRQVSVEDLRNAGDNRQLIVFTSDPDRPQQFYDKRTNTLYTIA